ncbi:MAG TPA: aldehyde dehydrogenase family protein [Terriglobales bacterium]|nr:aldehyde dehydrogenase family protein [Terriglobales bacterium]
MSTAQAEAKAFVSQIPLKMFIGGRWIDADGGKTFEVRDPGDGGVVAKVSEGDAKEVNLAVNAARQAFTKSGWATMPANDRAVILHRLADLIDRNCEIIAQIESLDVGKPVAQPLGFDVPNAAQTFRYYADLSVYMRRREPIAVSGFEARTVRFPYGVCGFIVPWNFPFLLLCWGIAPALAAGNTVVVKPAEDTPLSTLYFCKLAEEAGIPAGVINIVTGFGAGAGAALAKHAGINRMTFTGSPEVGRLVAESCGRNLVPVKLELGGKGAAVLFDDIDVEQAADSLVGAVTLNAGQVCCTATRWLVQEKIWDKFVGRASSAMQSLRIGYGGDPDTNIGPVVSAKQQSRVLNYLEKGTKEGATFLLQGGKADVKGHEKGFYVRPTLLTGSPDNVCAREEIFGPVAYVMRFKEEQEAVDLVNRSNYGLANSVWSGDLGRANRVAEAMVAGNSWINGHNLFAHGIPYGGCNLSGFGGGVLGPDTLLDYLRQQSVVRPLS